MSMQELMDQLNEQQREAVLINEGSLLVFAGAGSGKTRVITTKIAYAIDQLGVKPYRILAVTFTNKACKEMQDRVVDMIGEAGQGVMIRTFHSFGVWLLRKHGQMVGLDPNFKIYDDEDSVDLLCQAFPDDNKKEIAGYYKKIAVLKDRMEKPNKLDERLCRYYYKYEESLKRTGNVDFADMIIKSIELLENNPSVKEEIHRRFSMILVDEYQDSNKAQFLLLKQIVGPQTFICAVGDDDQSIYRFRGAEVMNILGFPKAFSNTKKVVLGKNYRCTESILNVAKDVIDNNETRAEKSLTAEKRGGKLPQVYYVDNGFDEAQQVINLLKKARETDPHAYENSAILYRTNSQSKDFEDRLMINDIPYHLVGSLRFYDREEIRDCIAMISLMSNPRDSVSFQRMINKPARKIGDVSIERIINLAVTDESLGGDMILAGRKAIEQGLIRGAAVSGVTFFADAYDRCSKLFGEIENGKFLKEVLIQFGILDYYVRRDNDEKLKVNKRTENIEQLVNMLSLEQFSQGQEGINSFLELASLDASSLGEEEGKNEGGVTLITMHNTKGLEYERVFMVGMENEIFPGRLDDRTMEDIEEERRICYVAMTRAKRELYMFCASSRLRWGNVQPETPSMFLKEIREEHIEEIDHRLKSRYGGQFRFDNRQSDYRSGYGNGFGNSFTSRFSSPGKYSSSYVNTNKTNDDAPAAKPQNTAFSKYNLKNLREQKLAQHYEAKSTQVPGTVTYEVGDRIRSDFYGEGTISGKRTFAGREVLDVKFDNGRTGTFASDKVAFEKI
ncbi:MAG: UvrD-helicase domain-containing protein [Spirochaetales bacterium]|nr:UvrD-helicase domain-containing protein [Spirochaetales bacterium]